jgi:hypothetical protein
VDHAAAVGSGVADRAGEDEDEDDHPDHADPFTGRGGPLKTMYSSSRPLIFRAR